MQPLSIFATAALIALAGSTTPHVEARDEVPEANLRFINRLTQDATVSANRTIIFDKVTPGSVTGWSAVRDTVTTFTLMLGTSDSIRATTTSQLQNGSHYTVAATTGAEGGVTLAVLRDNGPDDTVNIARPRVTGGGVVKP